MGLHYVLAFVVYALNIERQPETENQGTLRDHRTARRNKKQRNGKAPGSLGINTHQPQNKGAFEYEYEEWLKQDIVQPSRKGLIPSTILEEDDSSGLGF